MGVALGVPVLKWILGALCLVLSAISRSASAQSADPGANTVLPPPPPPPPGVTPEPHPSEEAAQPRPKAATQAPPKTAPPPLPDTNAALASGGREPIGDWQPLPRAATDAASPTKPIRAWYGWQMLATDAISYSLIGVGIGELAQSTSDGGNGPLTAGLLGYAFAPPIIHLVHGRPGMLAASLSVRIMVPAATLLIGTAAENCSSGGDGGPCNGDGVAAGLIIGFLMASAIDAGLFAWDKPVPPAVNSPQFGFTPVLSRDGKRAELRAFGAF